MRAALPLFFAALTIVPRDVWAQGNPLGPEFRVNTYTTNDQAQPSIAIDSSGNFVVVWEQSGQFGYPTAVVGQRFSSSGVPLGAEFGVSTIPFGSNSAPSVAADPAGNFVVIWEWAPLEAAGLLGQRFSNSGAPLGGEFGVGNSSYSSDPGAASDSAGNFVVAWTANLFTSASYDVFERRYSSSGAPLGSTFRANTYTTGIQSESSVAVDSAGNFVVVWSSSAQDGSALGVFGQRFASSGAPLGSEFRVNSYTTSNQRRPSVASDTSGNFVVVWESALQDGASGGVFGQRYAASGAPLGAEFLVNTYATGEQTRPSVASDASGNFVVVWESALQDGASGGVFGQRYDSSGAPLGPEFLVNTYTMNDQAEAAVAADPSGDFVVVWESNLQDGSAIGVFGQRWRPILPVELMNFRLE